MNNSTESSLAPAAKTPRRAKRVPGGCGPAEARKASDPPYANRGVDNLKHISPDNVFAVSVDWLTASVGDDVAGMLLDWSGFEREGGTPSGFKRSELRTCPGGQVWRRWEPRQPSKAHDLAYESWEWSGESSICGAKLLRLHVARPSRVDVCFNLSISAGLTADQVLEHARPHFESQGLTDGISGHGGINTRYIGSKASPRRIRIYRKDKQDQAWAHLYGSTIRIEIELKDEHARNWWKVWAEDEQKAYAVAAGHIEQMSGYRLMETEDVPELVKVEEAAPAARLAQFIKQHAGTLLANADAGIDVMALARSKMASSSSV